MARTTDQIKLTRKARVELDALASNGNTAQKIAKRARIVLLAADGLSVNAIMRATGAGKTSVWNWPKRYLEAGIDGLKKDKSKKPGKAPLPDAIKVKVVEMAATSGRRTQRTGACGSSPRPMASAPEA